MINDDALDSAADFWMASCATFLGLDHPVEIGEQIRQGLRLQRWLSEQVVRGTGGEGAIFGMSSVGSADMMR